MKYAKRLFLFETCTIVLLTLAFLSTTDLVRFNEDTFQFLMYLLNFCIFSFFINYLRFIFRKKLNIQADILIFLATEAAEYFVGNFVTENFIHPVNAHIIQVPVLIAILVVGGTKLIPPKVIAKLS